MTTQDSIEKKYFEEYKRKTVDACTRCSGRDPGCSCHKEFYFAFKKKEAGIPLQFWDASLNYYTDDEYDSVKRRITNYLSKFQKFLVKGKGLFLVGNHGVGKTSSAAYVLMELMKLGFSGKFKTLNEYIQACRLSRSDYAKYLEMNQELSSVDILVLDNVGSEKVYFEDQLVNNHFESLLRTRTGACRPTIFTGINTAGDWTDRSYNAGIKSLIKGFNATVRFPKTGDLREAEIKVMEEELDAPIKKR